MQTKTRRLVLSLAGMIGAWALAAVIALELIQPGNGEFALGAESGLTMADTIGSRLARALVAGINAGVIAAFLEIKVLPRYAKRVGVGVMLLARTGVYAAVALTSVLAVARFVAVRELSVSPRELITSEGFREFLRSPEFLKLIVAFVIASFFINATIQVARLLGPGMLRQILMGRYVSPVHEDRSFLFVDLADSTAIAEALGPLKFAEFKNDFFHDIAEPVLNSRGQIVQYVGDEVMVTWPAERRGRNSSADCVRCLFALEDQVTDRTEEYKARYGVVPSFRAGLHSGRVVVSQLGDIKREVAFSGDAVNTASRIQGLCKELGHDFLASYDVIDGLELPDAVQAEALGEHTLRGRTAPVSLLALTRTARS
ncbi:MAG: adenylate/guanylate cyclase domain-containing protein [Longimicrobiales bacterium]